MTTHYATTATPMGLFTAVVTDDVVLASGWTGRVELLLELIHPSLRPDRPCRADSLGEITRAITDYHDGDPTAVDGVLVRQRAGEFHSHAWDILRKVPAGQPVTYRDLADLAGRPAAIRAAAAACARNAAALFVPCHRVIRTGGGLGGFRWGLEVKQRLLDHEAAASH